MILPTNSASIFTFLRTLENTPSAISASILAVFFRVFLTIDSIAEEEILSIASSCSSLVSARISVISRY